MIKPPDSYKDPIQPIEHVPYFTTSGEFKYWPRLDTTRVLPDSFTYIIGSVFQNNLNVKIKLRLSVDEGRQLNPSLSNITTYAARETTRAFSRQLRKVYGVGRPKLIPEFQFHKIKIGEFLSQNSLTFDDCSDIKHGIPLSSSNKGNHLPNTLMSGSFVSLVVVGDIALAVLTIGKFQKVYELSQYNDKHKTKKDVNYPVLEFVDNFDSDFEEIDESDFF